MPLETGVAGNANACYKFYLQEHRLLLLIFADIGESVTRYYRPT